MEHSSTEQIVWTHRRKSWIQPCSSFHLIIKIPILRNIYPIFKHSQTKENHGLSCLNSYGWSQNTHKITMFHTFSSPNKYTNRFLGIVWKYPKSNGLSWFIMVYHGLSWFIMVYHGLSLRNWPFFWGYPFSDWDPHPRHALGLRAE